MSSCSEQMALCSQMETSIPVKTFIYSDPYSSDGITTIEVSLNPVDELLSINKLESESSDTRGIQLDIDRVSVKYGLDRGDNPWKHLGIPDSVAEQKFVNDTSKNENKTSSQPNVSINILAALNTHGTEPYTSSPFYDPYSNNCINNNPWNPMFPPLINSLPTATACTNSLSDICQAYFQYSSFENNSNSNSSSNGQPYSDPYATQQKP